MENDASFKDEGQVDNNTSPQAGSEGSPEPDGKTINISGKSFVVSDDVAQAITELTTDVDRRFQERSEELGGLRQFKNDTLQREKELEAASHKQEKPNLSTLMYEDPDEFVGAIEEKIEKAKNDLRAEYQQKEIGKRNETDFWDGIWDENPDLALKKKDATRVINMLASECGDRLKGVQNTRQLRDAFAKEARDFISGISKGNISNSQDGFVEGASITTQTKQKKTEEKPRKTTKQILEERREKKRKAMADRT